QIIPVVAKLWVLTVHPVSPWHGYRDLDGISITAIVSTCPGPDSVVLRPLHPSLHNIHFGNLGYRGRSRQLPFQNCRSSRPAHTGPLPDYEATAVSSSREKKWTLYRSLARRAISRS